MRWTWISVGGDTNAPVKCTVCQQMIDGSRGNDLAFWPEGMTDEQTSMIARIWKVHPDFDPTFAVCNDCKNKDQARNFDEWLNIWADRTGHFVASDGEEGDSAEKV